MKKILISFVLIFCCWWSSFVFADSPIKNTDGKFEFLYDIEPTGFSGGTTTWVNPYSVPLSTERTNLQTIQNNFNNLRLGIRTEWSNISVKFATMTAPVVKTSTIQANSPLAIFIGTDVFRFDKQEGGVANFTMPQNSEIRTSTQTGTFISLISITTQVIINSDMKLSNKTLSAEEIVVFSQGLKAHGRIKNLIGDVETSSNTKGLILTAQNNSKWLVWVDNPGTLFTTQIASSPEVSHEIRMERMEQKRMAHQQKKDRRNAIPDTSSNPADLKARIEILEEILGLR